MIQRTFASRAEGLFPCKRVDERPSVDRTRLVGYRQERIREELRRADIPLAVLMSPVSLRYAADHRDYALFTGHIPTFYCFVPAEGPVVMFGATATACGVFDERRSRRGVSYFDAGPNLDDEARRFAGDVGAFLAGLGFKERRIALEYVNPGLTQSLLQSGFEVLDAVGLMEHARAIKSDEEIACMRWSIRVAEEGMRRMREALAPGITENELWSILHATNIANDGDPAVMVSNGDDHFTVCMHLDSEDSTLSRAVHQQMGVA